MILLTLTLLTGFSLENVYGATFTYGELQITTTDPDTQIIVPTSDNLGSPNYGTVVQITGKPSQFSGFSHYSWTEYDSGDLTYRMYYAKTQGIENVAPVVTGKTVLVTSSEPIENQQIHVCGTTELIIIYQQTISGVKHTKNLHSDNRGETWYSPVTIWSDEHDSIYSETQCVYEGENSLTLAVLGVDSATGDLELVRSNDFGQTLETEQVLNPSQTSSQNASIIMGGSSDWHVVVEASGKTWYIKSSDNGINWNTPVQPDTDDNMGALLPRIFQDQSDPLILTILWSSDDLGLPVVSRSTDGGVVWNTSTFTGCDTGANGLITFSHEGSTIYVICSVSGVVNARHSTNMGSTWSSFTNIGSTDEVSSELEIFAFQDQVYYFFQEFTDGTNVDCQSTFVESLDRGVTFETPSAIVSTEDCNVDLVRDNSIVSDGNNIFVFYSDSEYNLQSAGGFAATNPDPVDELELVLAGDDYVDLNWYQPNLHFGTLQNYTVYYTTPFGVPNTFYANTTNTDITVSGLDPLTDYSFTVDVTTDIGTNTGGNVLDVTTVDFLLIPPEPVDDLIATTIGETFMDLDWTQPPIHGGTLQNYTVYYTTPFGVPNTFYANTTNTSITVSGLSPETDYSFTVDVSTELGTNTNGNVLDETTLASPPPVPPDPVDDLTETTTADTFMDLDWTQPLLNGGTLQNYTVYYTTPFGVPNTFYANTTNTEITVSGLSPETDYSFTVDVTTEDGTNSSGNVLDNTTLASPPPIVSTISQIGFGTAWDIESVGGVLPLSYEVGIYDSAENLIDSYSGSITVSGSQNIVSVFDVGVPTDGIVSVGIFGEHIKYLGDTTTADFDSGVSGLPLTFVSDGTTPSSQRTILNVYHPAQNSAQDLSEVDSFEEAKSIGFTVIGILPIALFFGLFTILSPKTDE
jgi:chitodextrinase